MKLVVPELSLVTLIGPSGAGKSTFARDHFKATEVLSSDVCRGLVSDDENNQEATGDAFEVLHFIAAKRLAAGKLTVVDATNLHVDARKPLIALARQYHFVSVAVALDVRESVCNARNQQRADRTLGRGAIERQAQQMKRALRGLKREGFRYIYTLNEESLAAGVSVERQPVWTDRRSEHGPFDIIGDIHGCRAELESLLERLGYDLATLRHPSDRRLVFLGDLVDRGPDVPGVLRIAMRAVASGSALCVPGNHEVKLLRWLRGEKVRVSHGLTESIAQLEREPPEFREQVVHFIDSLVSHYVLDDGKLVVAHAGMNASMQGRASRTVREFALYGDTTGETDEFGLPVRYDWAADYRGRALVVYGHTPNVEPERLNNTINIDTGCVFGGKLTALRYPENELVSVPAEKVWFEPIKPLVPRDVSAPGLTSQQELDDLLALEDVLGKQIIATRLHRSVTIREEHALAALEVMSRFAANPKWLVYLPPTMSPCETSTRDLLEHPSEAFQYFRRRGLARVICEEKHMGSRVVIVVCRDPGVAKRRFGVTEEESGICYTRSGRRFFDDAALESQLLERIRQALDKTGFWAELETDWVCLDCELLPWSAKAQELIRGQYAAVATAARVGIGAAMNELDRAAAAGIDVEELRARTQERAQLVARYSDVYRRYCWPVSSIDDLRVAPFHVLASDKAAHFDRDHLWHMQWSTRLAECGDSVFQATSHRVVDLADAASQGEGVRFWEELTARGGEGMVVKPIDFIATGRHGLVQPAVKCRGPEYLRLIYGLEYSLPQHLTRLRARALSVKRSLALRELALGVEGLERFVGGEPLRRVHQCVFGVLALESDPVDPRL